MDLPAAETKHPQVPGVELAVLKVIFSTERNDFVDAPRAMRLTGMTIAKFDALMHAAAQAGYVRHVTGRNRWDSGWQIGNKARRLRLDKEGARIGRAQVDRVIAELPTRARALNVDPERRRMIRKICLFGSALHDQPDYGDVDVFIEVAQRPLSRAEWARLDAIWRARASESMKQGIMGAVAGNATEQRDAMSRLKKGLKGLSVMKDDPESLGTPYRVIFQADENGRELPVSGQLVVPEKVLAQPDFPELSGQVVTEGGTYVLPSGFPALHDPIIMTGIRWVSMQCLWELEAEWPLPSDHRLPGMAALHGAQHLCPAWKGDKPGMQMLVEALAWAEQNGAKAASYPRYLSLQIRDRSRTAWLGNYIPGANINRVADRIDGYVYEDEEGPTTTRADIAAHFAIGVALGKMLDEIRLGGDADTMIRIDLSSERRNRYEALPDLSKVARDVRKTTMDHLGPNLSRGPGKRGRKVVDAGFVWSMFEGQLLSGLEGNDNMTSRELDRFLNAAIKHGNLENEELRQMLKGIPGLRSISMRAVRPY